MVWLAVDRDGRAYIYGEKPYRVTGNKGTGELNEWDINATCYVELPKGFIEKLLGRSLTWEDEAVCVE